MTCLHCGKKLGFFSRYKDTPFCSEAHLRTHQDELDQTLIERLGSKSVAPLRDINELRELSGLASMGAPLDPMAGLEAMAKPNETKVVQAAAPLPVVETMSIEAVKEPAFAAPPPLHEEYLYRLPIAVPALEPTRPLIPSFSAAIIHKAVYQAPQTSDFVRGFGFAPAETVFELEAESLLQPADSLNAALPRSFAEDSFGEPWIEIPGSSLSQPNVDFELTGEEIPLDYEPVSTSVRHAGLGHRNELESRIRLRFPYAASQVTSLSGELPEADEPLQFTCGSDWDPVQPAPEAQLQAGNPFSSCVEHSLTLDVKLSISALLHFTLKAADSEDFGNSLSVVARALGSQAGLAADCDAGNWATRIVLPGAVEGANRTAGWQFRQSAERVRPVPFPSMFQLGSVLPPRPEIPAG